ncbi:hypothetical protein SK128_021806 [Halocaridina rubra]|uniref:Uncharacterized protein n=1 Tax=Halocaridina rubra TaxID=373956 RepID=A0AAN8X2L2_HALRR
MPVRSHSRRLGGSLYRWVVLRLLRRRLHPEGHCSRNTNNSSKSNSRKHTNCASSKPKKHYRSIRLCGGGQSPCGTGSSPNLKENGKSPTFPFEENGESLSFPLEETGSQSRETREENYNASTRTISTLKNGVRRKNSFQGVILQKQSLLKKGASLPHIDISEKPRETAPTFCSVSYLVEEPVNRTVFLVGENVGRGVYDPLSHINLPDQGDDGGGGDDERGRHRRAKYDTCEQYDRRPRRDDDDVIENYRTTERKVVPRRGECDSSRGCVPSSSSSSSSKKLLRNEPQKVVNVSTPNPFPLLNVRGLEAESIQSLTVPSASLCQHISALRRWDSISVLYGIEYIIVRKKVHERLLCILRERRERRLRREVRESILSGKKRPHKRKGKKRKGKNKTDRKKDARTKRKDASKTEENHCVLAASAQDGDAFRERESDKNIDKSRVKEKNEKQGRDMGKEKVGEEEEDEEGGGGGEGKENDNEEVSLTNFSPPEDSHSLDSLDSRPEKSPSYHQVTSSEEKSSKTRDFSPRINTARSSLRTVSSDTSSSSSSTSSSSTQPSLEDDEEEEEEEGEEEDTTSSAKIPGGPSIFATKPSQVSDYISEDESASERRSSFYCCPCFYTFKRKIKKFRKSSERERERERERHGRRHDRDYSSERRHHRGHARRRASSRSASSDSSRRRRPHHRHRRHVRDSYATHSHVSIHSLMRDFFLHFPLLIVLRFR